VTFFMTRFSCYTELVSIIAATARPDLAMP